MTVIGYVTGKNVIIVDDLVDTAGTLCNAAQLLLDNGAKSVRALITHPVMSGKAYERIAESALTELVVCNTIPLKEGADLSKIKVLSVEDIFATAIKNAYEFTVLNPGVPTGDPRFDQYEDPATLLSNRNSYREARDQCLIGLGLLYVLQVVDATVEAHFFEFNVSDNLSLNVQPQVTFAGANAFTGMQLSLRLK
jgi:hypothetical protein